MKKLDYKAPMVEVIEIEVEGAIMSESSDKAAAEGKFGGTGGSDPTSSSSTGFSLDSFSSGSYK